MKNEAFSVYRGCSFLFKHLKNHTVKQLHYLLEAGKDIVQKDLEQQEVETLRKNEEEFREKALSLDDQLRSTILVMLLIDIFGCLLWDRAMIALFAPKIFRASMEATSVQEMIRGAGKLVVSGGAIWLLVNDGGIVSILIIFWLYRSGFF